MAPTEGGLIQENLGISILRVLSEGPSHGYGIARWVHAATDGALARKQREWSARSAAMFKALRVNP